MGPQYSPVISFKDNAGNDVKKDFQSGYMSGIVGLQVILPMHFVVGARYVLGMTNINNEDASGFKNSWMNRSIQLHVGFRIL